MLRKSLIAFAGLVSVATACAKESDTQTAAPQPYVAPTAATVAQPQPVVTSGAPQPVSTVPAAAAPATGAMATPGPLALPCTSDASCGLAKCNVQFQKCAYPCASAVDCAAGATCNTLTGLCLPGVAPQ